MSFRLRHEWTTDGPTLPGGVKVSTCPHCWAVRAVGPDWTRFVRFAREDRADRVSERDPPCIEPRAKSARPSGRPGWTLAELVAAGKATDEAEGAGEPDRSWL